MDVLERTLAPGGVIPYRTIGLLVLQPHRQTQTNFHVSAAQMRAAELADRILRKGPLFWNRNTPQRELLAAFHAEALHGDRRKV